MEVPQKQQIETQTSAAPAVQREPSDTPKQNHNHHSNIYSNSPSSIHRSTENISRQSAYENNGKTATKLDSSDSGTTATTSEYSTEEQSTSGTSTPTRHLIDGGGSGDGPQLADKQVKSEPSSRPLSVVSTASTRTLKDEDEARPKTAASFVTPSTPISVNISAKSATSSVENLSNFNSSRRQSSVNISIDEASHSDEAPFDANETDAQVAAADAAQDQEPQEIDDHVDNSNQIAHNYHQLDETGSQTSKSDTGTVLTEEYEEIDPNDDQSPPPDESTVDPTTRIPCVIKRNRPPVLLRKRRVSPTKSSTSLLTHTTNSSPQKHQQQELFPSGLRHFDKPRESLNTCLHQLDSTNWEETMIGLQSFVRLMRYHPDYIEPQIHLFSVALCKNIKNLRSQVSRASCQAAGEFFETKARLLETEADDLAMSLLNRTADTNKFLRSDASRALEAMCDHMPTQKVIQIMTMRGATHQNAIVRTASAKLCNRIIERIGCDRVFAMNRDQRDRIILTGANLLMEGSLETRNHAKQMFKQLSMHPNYNRTLLEVIPSRTYRNIEKTLKSIK